MRVVTGGLEGIRQCADLLRAGDVVAIPTETVYGLAAVAFDAAAVAKIFAAKERPSFDPLIVHIPEGWGSLAALDEQGITAGHLLSPAARDAAERLMQRFWPGPLTLVLPRGAKIPDLVTSGLTTVAIRMPRHTVALELLRELQLPLAAPSANRFGHISPTTSAAVQRELGVRVGYVLEGGPCEVGLESTIVHIAPDATPTLLRPGGLPREDIESLLGRALLLPQSGVKSTAELAPGMLASHYAPRKPLLLFDRTAPPPFTASDGVLWLAPPSEIAGARVEVVLSEAGDPREMARRLFSSLRRLDEDAAVMRLFAERPVPTAGLWAAIADRLQRAAAPKAHASAENERLGPR